jgi:hypothetical protein
MATRVGGRDPSPISPSPRTIGRRWGTSAARWRARSRDRPPSCRTRTAWPGRARAPSRTGIDAQKPEDGRRPVASVATNALEPEAAVQRVCTGLVPAAPVPSSQMRSVSARPARASPKVAVKKTDGRSAAPPPARPSATCSAREHAVVRGRDRGAGAGVGPQRGHGALLVAAVARRRATPRSASHPCRGPRPAGRARCAAALERSS